MSLLKMSNADNLNIDQLMIAMDLEERHLKTNRVAVEPNPDNYESYLQGMYGKAGEILSYEEWTTQNIINVGA